jgi:hypothetical protein
MNDASDMERMRILERIERGEINAAEGMHLLGQLPAGAGNVAGEPIILPPDGAAAHEPDLEQWKRWWAVPFTVGAVAAAFAGLLMLSAVQASGYGFWFACLWLPFLAGVAVMALAWASRTARWLHLRVDTGRDEWPRNIAISLPIPLRFTAWLLHELRPHVPPLHKTALDELVLALGDSSILATPLYVEVAEGAGGERVQVSIG